jgi:hypothetical protein
MEIILLFIGAGLGWVITHNYSAKASSEQSKLFEKLSDELRDIILTDSSKKLTVLDLNNILNDKILDKNDEGPLNYKLCPKCGSKNLSKVIYYEDIYSDWDNHFTIECQECKWTKSINAHYKSFPMYSHWKMLEHPHWCS